MASGTARAADDLSVGVRSIVDRVLEADVTETIAQRGKEIAAALTDATESAAERAQQAWRDSEPARRDATKWGRRTWSKEVRPQLRNLWKRRAVALGAAGAAVPAGRELVDVAAERLKLRRREQRHWGAFFVGMVLGAIAGAAIALLTAPKPGREMRDELAEKARGAAENAPEWVPLFQREANGHREVTQLDEPAPPPSIDADQPATQRESDEMM